MAVRAGHRFPPLSSAAQTGKYLTGEGLSQGCYHQRLAQVLVPVSNAQFFVQVGAVTWVCSRGDLWHKAQADGALLLPAVTCNSTVKAEEGFALQIGAGSLIPVENRAYVLQM